MEAVHVIDRSFVLLPGVGARTERSFWSQGIENWHQLVGADRIEGVSARRLKELKEFSEKVIDLISSGRGRELGALLPERERWRLLGDWNDWCASMDAEAVRSGGSFIPVVVSLRRGFRGTETFVRGDDLCWRALDERLIGVDFLVTFNGSSFDLPMLESNGFRLTCPVHIDLRRYCPRARLRGGLKEIERQIGIRRPRELEFATSEQVSYLWRLWERHGNRNALDLLIRYNRQDADSLLQIAEHVYDRLAEEAMRA